MCVGGKTKSDVIRELVRRALYARRYRQASTDPAFRELLAAFDDLVGVRFHHLEARPAARMEADSLALRGPPGYAYFATWFGNEELKHIWFTLTDEDVTEEQSLAPWNERFKLVKETAEKNMRANAEKRPQRIAQAAGGDGSVAE